jgi:hypothetical protein
MRSACLNSEIGVRPITGLTACTTREATTEDPKFRDTFGIGDAVPSPPDQHLKTFLIEAASHIPQPSALEWESLSAFLFSPPFLLFTLRPEFPLQCLFAARWYNAVETQ